MEILLLIDEFEWRCFWHLCITHGNAPYSMSCKIFECFFCNCIITHHDRYTLVTAFTYALHQWYLTKKWEIIFFGQSSSTFSSENVIFIIWQLCRCEVTHVLYQPNDR